MEFPQLFHNLWELGGDFLKFIIPQNYNFKSKLLGIIDYSTAILNIIWFLIMGFIINLIKFNLKFKIFLFILLCFPLFIFSIVGFNGESITYVLKYILKYLIRPKVYVFGKVPRKIY